MFIFIAIVGSPNVGKSSLFNNLIRKKKSIVESTHGVTRNRLVSEMLLKDRKIKLIDTGGIKAHSRDKIDECVYKQVEQSLKEADVILFICDALAGATSIDYHVSSLLRKTSKKILLVVNKVDKQKNYELVFDFYQLGMGQPYSISVLGNDGIEKLKDDIYKTIADIEHPPKVVVSDLDKPVINIAIVGRPNVGKSSFINAVIQEDVVIVEGDGCARITHIGLRVVGEILDYTTLEKVKGAADAGIGIIPIIIRGNGAILNLLRDPNFISILNSQAEKFIFF